MGGACSTTDEHDQATVAPASAATLGPVDTPPPLESVAAGGAGGAGNPGTSAADLGEPEGDDPDAVDADEDDMESDLDDADAGAEAGAGGAPPAAPPTAGDGAQDLFTVEDAAAGDQFMATLPWLGAIKAPTGYSPSDADTSKPDAALELEYVHGYRCRGVYNNIGYLASGEVVYPAAAVAVMQRADSKEQRHFQAHTDDIVALSVSLSSTLVATGGKARIGPKGRGVKPRAFVWRAIDGSVVSEMQGFHSRSISALCFAADERTLFSVGADNDHCVAVHDVRTGALLSSAKGGTERIVACAWSGAHDTIVTVGVKHCVFWTAPRGVLQRPKKGLVGKVGQRCTQLSAAWTGDGAWTGTMAGHLYHWAGHKLQRVTKGAHAGRISALATSASGDFVASGGADNTVKVWNARDRTQVASISVSACPRALAYGPGGSLLAGTLSGEVLQVADPVGAAAVEVVVRGHFDGELWGCCAHPFNENVVATAGDDNMIAVWDLARHELVARTVVHPKAGPMPTRKRQKSGGASTMGRFPPNQCARAMDWGPAGTLAVAANDGRVVLLNEEDLSRVAERRDTKQWIQVVKFDPTGDFLAVGSHDGAIYIYSTAGGGLELVQRLNKHHSYITHLDWSEDGSVLHSNSGDYELLFFNPGDGSQLPDGATMLRDEPWATWTCTLGWPVQGIFRGSQDGTDINTVDRNPSATLLATGDDDGVVNLYRWPCEQKGANRKTYNGHASHVTNVRFTLDDSRLVTTGGNDNTLMVWLVK